jgi:hypothetical protein
MATRGPALLVLLLLDVMLTPACANGFGWASVTLSGKVTEYVADSQAEGPPIAGVEVCQLASNNCALSDENGNYELPLLMNREVALSHLKDGFGPVLVARFSGMEDLVGNVVMATDAVLGEFASELDTPYPLVDTGALMVTTYRGPSADGNRIAGVSYALLGSNGRSYYLDDSGVPQTSLTQTQTPGAGGFVELAPVTVTLQLSGAAVNCTSEESWPAAASNAFRLPIRAGFITQSTINCE